MLQEVSVQQQDNQPQTLSPIDDLSQTLEADLFLFSGPINRSGAELLRKQVEIAPGKKNAALILTTYGGDPDAAFIIARTLQTSYEKFDLYLFGPCKSAGTLLALGAKQIIMSDRAELGPLDVQLLKDDELIRSSSGLDISMAVDLLRQEYANVWTRQFLSMIALSSGNISTKTAAEVANAMALGLLSPITAQIDPLKLGEVQRAMEIAYHYGIRLGAQPDAVMRLVKDYPSHSFVIDFKEAKKSFPNVRRPTLVEIELERTVRGTLSKRIGVECIRQPHPKGIAVYLITQQEKHDDSQSSNTPPRNIAEDPLGAEQ